MRRRALTAPALIGVLFLAPFMLAVLAYFGVIGPSGRAQLQNPDRTLLPEPVPLPRLALRTPGGGHTAPDWARYRWSLIYARMTPCQGQCAAPLARLTEVYLALGRDRSRAQRVLLLTDEEFRMTGDPELLVAYLDGEHEGELIQVLGQDLLAQGRIFIVDPLGNLVMSYPPEADQARLLKDLERLLDVSRIG
jgi:cytochrome oxidase Cu insertion factor (SCO1/SenC/PrrC family)